MLLSFQTILHLIDDCTTTSPPEVFVHFDNKNNNDINEIDDTNLVVNLSKYTLSPAQYSLLKRGLKFCPNPGEPDLSTYQADLNKFHLRLKRYLHFYKPVRNAINETSASLDINNIMRNITLDKGPFQHQKFKNPSAWIPPPVAH